MTRMLFDSLVSLLGRRSNYDRDMLTYAKTEYKNDWRYAYSYMLSHGGKGPTTGVYQCNP